MDTKNRDKPRRKHSKFSSVNSRLDPSFDLRELLRRKDEESKSKNVEMDPRTMEFEKLVSMLHPAFILEYLQKILHFLSSSMTKMSFQNIALYKEILLVRLCQEKSNLNCVEFSEEGKKVARQIVELLKANQNVYEWICKYERGTFCPDVLVYEKVYNRSENLRLSINNESNDIGPTQNSNANGDSTAKVVKTTANKAHMLNTLLKFIKDNTQLRLEYPKVHKSQATLLTSIISQGKLVDEEVGFGCKSLYAPLYEALNAYKKVYDFNITFQTDSDVTLLLILQKIPKPTKLKLPSPRQNDHGDQKNTKSNASESSQNADSNKSKRMTKLESVGAVEESFIRASLKEVLEFMEDDTRASLEFTKLTKEECGFLSRTLQYSRDARSRGQFAPANRALLRAIDAAARGPRWRLAFEVGRMDRATRLQSITMLKEPYYREKDKPTTQAAPAQPARAPRGPNVAAKAKAISFQSASATDTEKEAETEKTIDKPEMSKDEVAKLVANNSRKSKLLAAMSVPVECDKGERMMRLMGWQGGALGVRGEGITEPIIPALHIAPGAGLGHIKHVKTTQTISEFRCQFLNGILSFLRGEESETTLEYDDCLERTKIRFVNRTMQSLKQGIGFTLSRVEEKHLLEKVFEEMRKQGKLVEGGVSDPNKKKIMLTKAPFKDRKVKVKQQKNNSHSNSKNSSPRPLCNQNSPVTQNGKSNGCTTEPLSENQVEVQNIELNGCITEFITENLVNVLKEQFNLDGISKTPKAAQNLAYKVIALRKIHDFLQIADEKRRYVFEREQGKKIGNKIKSYISTVIMNVNGKVTQKFGSVLESVIYDDIRKATPAGCCLSVVFENLTFTLAKKVYQKRFTNSARDLPPPKSTDLENTIIYKNNKIISCNGVVNIDNDDSNEDDDVILIEKKIDVIEISDSDDNDMEEDTVTVSAVQNEYSEKTEEISADVIIEDSLDDSLVSIDFSQNLSTSRETLLLETLENDSKVETENVDTELDTDIKELEQAILDCDFLFDEETLPMPIISVKQELIMPEDDCKEDMEALEINNNNSSLIAENKPDLLVSDFVQLKETNVEVVDCAITEKHTTYKSLNVLQTTEINNGDQGQVQKCSNLTKEESTRKIPGDETNTSTINKSSDNSHHSTEDDYSEIENVSNKEKWEEEIKIRLQANKENCIENRELNHKNKKHITEAVDSVQKSTDISCFNETETDLLRDYKDRSPSYVKRSRSSSITSEPESLCKKCKNQIRSVRITCKEPNKALNKDIVRKVQSVISESIDIIIDNVDFLPRLECHGVKDGGLIYSCHDDKTFAWLTNFVVSDLDLNITETDYLRKTYLEIKIYSFEDVDKILKRLKLYNPELDTSLWRIIDKKELEEYVIITVEIDKESFDIVNRNNYSFFAGIDKAKFNIVWS